MIRNPLERVGDLTCELGESPLWDDRRETLFLCDIVAHKIHEVSESGKQLRSWRFDEPVCAVGLTETGRLIVALTKDVILFDPDTESRQPLAHVGANARWTRLNDGKVGPDGAFWVGSLDDKGQGAAALYRVDATGGCDRVVEGLNVSNGLAWSVDGETIFHSDSRGPWIRRSRFRCDDPLDLDWIAFATPDETTGRPDGATSDTDGHYWSAGVSAGVINGFDRGGKLADVIPCPASAPTMPCFGGPGLDVLFVTSHRLSPTIGRPDPEAGGLFRTRVDARGAKPHRMPHR